MMSHKNVGLKISKTICRLCLGDNANIYVFDNNDVLNNMVSYCKVQIQKDDGLPGFICSKCLRKVGEVTKFIKQCCKNEKTLWKKLNKANTSIQNDEDNMNLDNDETDINNDEIYSSPCDENKPIEKNDSVENKDTIQRTESGEEYLYYLGVKIIINQPKLLKKKISSKLCPICGVLADITHRHDLCHQPKTFICDICGSAFKKKYNLAYHLRTHSDARPFQCDVCEKAYKFQSDWRKHKNRSHNESQKRYPCMICGKEYKVKAELKDHLTKHIGKQNYECDHCHKKCYYKRQLAVHMRVHTKVKPYTCKICKKSFAMSGTLRDHVRLHTGERPYECPVCNKGYAQLANMKSHFKHNHKGIKYEYKPKKLTQST